VTIDSLVDERYRRFKLREFEEIHFDFGNGEQHRCPEEDEIRDVILKAMEKAEIPHDGLTDENRKQIELYFNQFLPRGKKKRVFVNVTGDLTPFNTVSLERSSLRIGELDRDATAFISESYEEELDDRSKLLIKYLTATRKPKEPGTQQELSFIDSTGLLGKHSEYVRPIIEKDDRSPYIVNPSVLKSPQSSVLVSHYPEKEFVFRLLEHEQYLDAWIKSPDKGFYSIDYEYWKGGKDRVRHGFNPDFFIKINLDHYIALLKRKGEMAHLLELRDLQDKGYETLIRVVEIKADDDDDEATPAKAEWAKAHFELVNAKLLEPLPGNFPPENRNDIKQYYTFDLLKPAAYNKWFEYLRSGKIGI